VTFLTKAICVNHSKEGDLRDKRFDDISVFPDEAIKVSSRDDRPAIVKP